MKLIALAKSLKPFLQKEITLEGIYKEIFTNKSIPFTSMITPVEVVKLVFITKKVLNNEDPKEIMSKLDNGLFLFSTVEFGDSNQEEECSECYGDGRLDCSNCDGEGEIPSGTEETGHYHFPENHYFNVDGVHLSMKTTRELIDNLLFVGISELEIFSTNDYRCFFGIPGEKTFLLVMGCYLSDVHESQIFEVQIHS